MTLADILIPLAGSISNEKALAMRKACDELEAKVETLKLRVNGLESMVLELKDATKNIALHTDETLRAVRGGGCTCTHEKRLHANATDGCLVSGYRCETYTGEGRAEEALSGNGRDQERAQPVRAAPPGAQALDVAGEGREPSRQAAPSPASPSPDAVEALARELQRAHHDGAWSDVPLWTASETSQRGYLAEARYVLSRYEPRGAGAGAPTTAPPLPGGEGVPLKVAESFSKPGDYIVWRGIRGIATFHGPDAKANAETFASRAPRPVSVEEMAERLRVAWNAWAGYAPGVVISPSDCWLALARAALAPTNTPAASGGRDGVE